jgi:plastocyanin
MKESLKRRLNVFLKLRRQLASLKWILLFITTVMFFLSAASDSCTFSFPSLSGKGSSGSSSSELSTAPTSSPAPTTSSPALTTGSVTPTTSSSSSQSSSQTSSKVKQSAKRVVVLMTTGAKTTSGFGFSPEVVNINVGDTVVWENPKSNPAPHTVTSGTSDHPLKGPLNSPPVKPGGTFSYTFNTAGTFPYYCQYHSGQVGKVVVS